MLEIYLCRHGQSVANAEGKLAGHFDSPLTATGKQQAAELGQLAKDAKLRFDYVYCSPLKRAKQTAKIVCQMTNSPAPEVLADLIERDFGVLTGKHYSDIPKYAKEMLDSEKIGYFLDAEGCEKFPEALERANRVLEYVRARHKDGKILLSSHGDLGMMLFAAFHKTPWKEALRHFHLGNSELLLLREDMHHKPHVFEIDQRGIKEKT